MKSIYFLSFNISNYVPYAYGLLRAYAEQDSDIIDNYEWIEPLCEIEPVEAVLEKIVDPDILLCSCYVWNHRNHMKVAERIKELYPESVVICGGPHIPNSSKEFFKEFPQVDFLVHGEGEVPLKNLLVEILKKNPDPKNIDGLSVNINNEAFKTHLCKELPKDLPIPSPYLLGFFDNYIKTHKNPLALWETNRGCPFGCTYCSWGISNTNKIKTHDIEKLKKEIEFMGKNNIREIHNADANFGLLERDLDIVKMVTAAKKEYGFPLGLRFTFAKNSNEVVFNISKELFNNDMLWGTTLSMQSVNEGVQKSIKRPSIGLQRYEELKQLYNQLGIHTYTELILGLPLETKETFINGICDLFKIGIHEDIRVFELAMLPNAPLNSPESREKYGFKTKFKPIHLIEKGRVRESVELVFETNTMPFEGWSYCLLFSEFIQALHNGAYTRFLSIFLNDTGVISYRDFYQKFLDFSLESDSESLKAFKRIEKLIDDYYHDPDIPQVHRLMTQPDIVEFLGAYSQNRKGWKLYIYTWLWISINIEDFYRHLELFLEKEGITLDIQIKDLLQYQKDLMITLDYDPEEGKKKEYSYNWHEYFFNGQPLKEETTQIHFTDTHMGNSHRYALVKNHRNKFLNAAVGCAWPYSKFRHFFHQPDKAEKL